MTNVRLRRWVIVTVAALVAIFVGVSGFELPVPRLGGPSNERAPLPGVRAVAASTLLRASGPARRPAATWRSWPSIQAATCSSPTQSGTP